MILKLLGIMLVPIFVLLNHPALACEITKIGKKDVTIDEGSDSGFKKGVKICFTDSSGKTLTCSKVKSSKASQAIVPISTKNLKKLKAGISCSTSSGKSSTTETSEKSGSSKNRTAFKGLVAFTMYSPASYSTPEYVAPQIAPTDSEVWSERKSVAPSFIGLGGEAMIPFLGKYIIASGLKYKLYPIDAQPVEESYSNSDATAYVSHKIKSDSSIELWGDFCLNFPFSKSLSLTTGGGLDIDMSSFTFSATQKYDTKSDSKEIASAKSKITVLSLRGVANIEFSFSKSLKAFGGTILFIPVFDFMKSTSATVDDPNMKDSGVGANNLKAALNHKKSTYGVEFPFGMIYVL